MSERHRKSRTARRLMHGRSAVGGGLLVAGGLLTGAAAQASPAVHVEVFSDSGAAAPLNAGTTDFGTGSTKETLADAITYLDGHSGGTVTFASSLSGHTIHLAANLPEITANTTVAVSAPGSSRSTAAVSTTASVRWARLA
jgi:hypothetical protein